MFGPELAMLSTPRPLWDKRVSNSSLNGLLNALSPPVPVPEISRERKATDSEQTRGRNGEKAQDTYQKGRQSES